MSEVREWILTFFCVQPNSQGMSNGKRKFFDAASNETSFSMVPTESQIVPKPPPKKTNTLQQIFKASSFMIPKLKKKVNILQLKYFLLIHSSFATDRRNNKQRLEWIKKRSLHCNNVFLKYHFANKTFTTLNDSKNTNKCSIEVQKR